MSLQQFPSLPEAMGGKGYQVKIYWETHPSTPISGYYDWIYEMGKKGYTVRFYAYNGGNIPYDYAELKPTE